MTLDSKVAGAFSGVSTATIATELLKKGLRNVLIGSRSAAAELPSQSRGDAPMARAPVPAPAALLDDVITVVIEQQSLEGWVIQEVLKGNALLALYPRPNLVFGSSA